MQGIRFSHDESEYWTHQGVENFNTTSTSMGNGHELKKKWVEKDEPSVYITFMSLLDGTKELKHVWFIHRRFSEWQVENWWSKNCAWVFKQYNVQGVGKPTIKSTIHSMHANEDKIASYHLIGISKI